MLVLQVIVTYPYKNGSLFLFFMHNFICKPLQAHTCIANTLFSKLLALQHSALTIHSYFLYNWSCIKFLTFRGKKFARLQFILKSLNSSHYSSYFIKVNKRSIYFLHSPERIWSFKASISLAAHSQSSCGHNIEQFHFCKASTDCFQVFTRVEIQVHQCEFS